MINTVEVCPEIYAKYLAEWLSDNVRQYIDIYQGSKIYVDEKTLTELIKKHLNKK